MAGMSESANVLPLPPAPDAIELRHLRSFVAVAEELNFGRAAARLYVSQPALSRQIRALERLVGCDLLRRSTHRVELTVAGEALLDRARDVLRGLDDAVMATRSVGGELAGRAMQIWDEVSTAANQGTNDMQALRAAYEKAQEQFEPPPEVTIRSANAGGVPGLMLTTRPDQQATVLFLHGGGYVTGSAFGYRPLAGALAAAADAGVLVPDYRLAPEHPYPAALDDCLSAYQWMLARDIPAERITLAGDSIGGALVLKVMLLLRDQGLPMPAGGALMCPGFDATGTAFKHLMSPERYETIRSCGELYLDGRSPTDPAVNPLYADLTGLPPLLVQAATGDVVRDEAESLAERAARHGVDVKFVLYPGDMHVFHIFWSFLPEASDALRQIGDFANRA
jgi:epsilon-lactone hydrolase